MLDAPESALPRVRVGAQLKHEGTIARQWMRFLDVAVHVCLARHQPMMGHPGLAPSAVLYRVAAEPPHPGCKCDRSMTTVPVRSLERGLRIL